MGRGILLGAVCCGLMLAAPVPASALPPVRHVFVIVLENEGVSTSFGSGSPAPYLSQTLVSQGAYVPYYFGVGHNSLDNYIAMVSGQAPNPDTSADCGTYVDFPTPSMDATGQENGEGCIYPANVPTLMSQFDHARLGWRAYEDGMGLDPARESATCGHPTVGGADHTQLGEAIPPYDEYAAKHDPFVYFHYVIDNQAECNANVVNLNRLSSDLQSAATTPNYVFITPNLCDDGHDSPCSDLLHPGGLTQADQFLQTWVPVITSSPAYKQNGLLIVTFDEAPAGADDSACCNEQPGPYDAMHNILPGGGGPGGGDVGAVLLSPFVKAGTRSTLAYNHYSLLATVEDLFGLPRIADAVGVQAFGSDVFVNPPIAPPPGPGRLSVGRPHVSGKTVTVQLQCAGSSGSTCITVLTLTGTELIRAGKVIAVIAKVKTTRKPVRLDRATLTMTAGQTTSVRMSLNRLGIALLAKLHTLIAKLTVAENGKAQYKTIAFKSRTPREP